MRLFSHDKRPGRLLQVVGALLSHQPRCARLFARVRDAFREFVEHPREDTDLFADPPAAPRVDLRKGAASSSPPIQPKPPSQPHPLREETASLDPGAHPGSGVVLLFELGKVTFCRKEGSLAEVHFRAYGVALQDCKAISGRDHTYRLLPGTAPCLLAALRTAGVPYVQWEPPLNMTGPQFRVYLALDYRAKEIVPGEILEAVVPNQEDLAKELGLSSRSVRRTVGGLEALGFLQREGLYRVLLFPKGNAASFKVPPRTSKAPVRTSRTPTSGRPGHRRPPFFLF